MRDWRRSSSWVAIDLTVPNIVDDLGGMKLQIDPDELAPLLAEAAREAVAVYAAQQEKLPDKAMTEEEAAAWLGLEWHVLRDERRRGRITASRIVGRRIRYMRQDLIEYLIGRREQKPGR
jgi:hypothetical protein